MHNNIWLLHCYLRLCVVVLSPRRREYRSCIVSRLFGLLKKGFIIYHIFNQALKMPGIRQKLVPKWCFLIHDRTRHRPRHSSNILFFQSCPQDNWNPSNLVFQRKQFNLVNIYISFVRPLFELWPIIQTVYLGVL